MENETRPPVLKAFSSPTLGQICISLHLHRNRLKYISGLRKGWLRDGFYEKVHVKITVCVFEGEGASGTIN